MNPYVRILGKRYMLIPMGGKGDPFENADKNARCGDCGVKMGQFHMPGCDLEVCPVCHEQFISCQHGGCYIYNPRHRSY